MAAEYDLNQFNSHKNITTMPTSPGPSTSNNWGWADIFKKGFTLVELGPLEKWAAKPIDNKSDNTLKKGE
jgi:hypothetical protein